MHVDVAVIGGGIAGMSCAAFLAPRTSVTVLEAEQSLGYHATGRSAALYTECYGSEPIRRITLASKRYFLGHDEPLVSSRPVMFVAQRDSPAELDRAYGEFSPLVPDLRRLTPEEVHAYVPAIPPDTTAGALLEPGAFDLDVHAILTSYSTTVRKHDGRIITGEAALEITRTGSSWSIRTPHQRLKADAIVNAAGPWGDEVAVAAGVRPLGLTPLKRSVFTFDPGVPTTDWPMVVDIGERWYFKPEGPHILGSAASEIPEKPGDAHPDEIDVALGIERINQATTLAIRSVKSQWAGLRTFTRDRIPAVGRDPEIPNFFWLVGQGGYGIHTSPGIGALSAGLLLDGEVPEIVADHGVTAEMFDPGRFR